MESLDLFLYSFHSSKNPIPSLRSATPFLSLHGIQHANLLLGLGALSMSSSVRFFPEADLNIIAVRCPRESVRSTASTARPLGTCTAGT